MQNKYNTDIDRKLAIYYHPLFQQILNFVSLLFTHEKTLSLGLLEFLQFNLKLQKSLLPSFEIQNAVISGLNDWVKEVAQCLSFQGMVSTANCVEVTSQNISELILQQMKSSKISLIYPENEYQTFLKQFYTHDAFKLLGVKINNEVFCKFLFDLCSTWCQFLDVEIFVYFLLTLFLQITEGQTLKNSNFKTTKNIKNVEYQFFEDFQQLKQQYSKNKKKELRYYRAWCQWNYLRMNEIGQKVILDLHESFNDDPRIKNISQIFQKAIEAINSQITNQTKEDNVEAKKDSTQKPKQFLILKKLQIKKEKVPQQLQYFSKQPEVQVPKQQNEFQIEIDDRGNMYLKKIVKIPIIGTKINPKPFTQRQYFRRDWLIRKKQQYRAMSNLYSLDAFKPILEHNVKAGPYYYEKNQLLKQIQDFHEKKIPNNQKQKQKQKGTVIHTKKIVHKSNVQIQDQKQIQKQKQKEKNPLQKEKIVRIEESKGDFIHKVIAPSFLTNKEYNLSYGTKLNDLYGSRVGQQKRNLQFNLPKIFQNDVKEKAKGNHLIGKLLIDRKKIKDRLNNSQIVSKATNQSSNLSLIQQNRLQKLREQNRHIWSRYVSQEEMKSLTDYNQFYERLWKLKKVFSNEFKSDYVKMIKLDIQYEDTRYEMGGVITRQDKQNFRKRIQKLIEKNEKRQKRRKRRRRKAPSQNPAYVKPKQNIRNLPIRFRNKQQRELYNNVFINFHREQIKSIRQTK